MPRTSDNIFSIHDSTISISHPDWNFTAYATIRDDYAEELQSVTWSRHGDYLYNKKLGGYLHIYIMKKWYGETQYNQMKADSYVVDHMDNDGYNCRIENLCFLLSDENTAKAMTVDKMSTVKTHIALSLFKDFTSQLIQMTIVFNFPAVAKISTLSSPAVIDLAYLLYDCEYELVLNDARKILYDYRRDCSFEPEKLHDADYHIEGAYSTPYSKEAYDRYIQGGHGHTVFFFNKKAPLENWKVEDQRQFFHLRGTPAVD